MFFPLLYVKIMIQSNTYPGTRHRNLIYGSDMNNYFFSLSTIHQPELADVNNNVNNPNR